MVRPAFFASLFVCSLFAAGCVRSLHPIYTPQTLAYDEALLGTWANDQDKADRMRIEIRPGEGNESPEAVKSYRVVHTDDQGKSSELVAHLAKVGDLLVADLSIGNEKGLPGGDLYRAHLFPLHTFWVVQIDRDTLTVRTIGHDWMKKLLRDKPAAIAHVKDDNDVLLTASPEEVQKFLLAHAKDEGMLSDAETFQRQKPDTAAAGTKPTTPPP